MDPARAKRSSWLNDQRVLALAHQTLLLGFIAALEWSAIHSAVVNTRARAFRWTSAFGTTSPASTSISI
jgi:hypothetical protein